MWDKSRFRSNPSTFYRLDKICPSHWICPAKFMAKNLSLVGHNFWELLKDALSEGKDKMV